MIRAAICDGDRGERKEIRSVLEGSQLSLKVAEYDTVEALLWDMETDGPKYDLYIISADDGEGGERLRTADGDAALILLSEAGDAGREKQDARVVGWLERPVGERALLSLLEKAAKRFRWHKRRVIVITQRGRTRVLRFEDIEYISSANHILRFYLRGGEEQTCYGRLDQTVAQLDGETFVRCHQSHVVNLNWVAGHTAKAFQMSGGAVIPISRSYAAQARRALEEYLFLHQSYSR